MSIRFATREEKPWFKDMWQLCFGDGDPFLSWYFNTLFVPENTLAVCDNDIPVSSLQLLPYSFSFHGKPTAVTNIYGVFTVPEARNKGHLYRLIPEALQVMRERGSLFALLLPVKYELYRKFGWETCYYHLEYRLPMNSLRPLASAYGQVLQPSGAIDTDELNSVYEAYCHDRNGYIVRIRENWQNLLQDHLFEGGSICILKGPEGNTEGYVLFTVANEVLTIREMGYTGSKAAGGLWNFICSREAQAQSVVWKAPSDDMTYHLLTDAREASRIMPFVMGRIVDVHKVLELLLGFNRQALSIRILVEDAYAPWNNGIFHISPEKGVTREEKPTGDFDVKIGIDTLTTLSLGFLSPRQAAAVEKLVCRHPSVLGLLDSLFLPAHTYSNDYF